jgi:uncharacterized protein
MMPALLHAQVMHERTRPARRRFRYPMSQLLIPLSRMESIANRFLSVDRFNLASVMRRDHGPRDGSDLLAWARGILSAGGVQQADGEIWLQTMPRVLGYVFNPVSFWYCLDRDEALRAVLCEVNNTFGERHSYLLAHVDGRPIGPRDWLVARKVFHVSPFFGIEGHYRCRFRLEPSRLSARIDYADGDGLALRTAIAGSLEPAGSAAFLRALARQGWLGVSVMVRIHWQALHLWLRRVPFHKKPVPPADEVTIERA